MYSILTKRVIKVSFFNSGSLRHRTSRVSVTVRTSSRAHAVAKMQALAEKYGNAWLFKGTKDIARINY